MTRFSRIISPSDLRRRISTFAAEGIAWKITKTSGAIRRNSRQSSSTTNSSSNCSFNGGPLPIQKVNLHHNKLATKPKVNGRSSNKRAVRYRYLCRIISIRFGKINLSMRQTRAGTERTASLATTLNRMRGESGSEKMKGFDLRVAVLHLPQLVRLLEDERDMIFELERSKTGSALLIIAVWSVRDSARVGESQRILLGKVLIVWRPIHCLNDWEIFP